MAGFEILVSGSSFSKRIGLCESGHNLSAFRHIAQNGEVLFVNVDAKHNELLVPKFRAKRGGELGGQIRIGVLMHSGAADTGQHTNAARFEDAASFRKGMVTDEIVDYVVTLIALGEVLFRVINHVIGPQGSDQVQVLRAANTGYFRAKILGDLDGKCPDTAGCAVDQDLLPRFE